MIDFLISTGTHFGLTAIFNWFMIEQLARLVQLKPGLWTQVIYWLNITAMVLSGTTFTFLLIYKITTTI